MFIFFFFNDTATTEIYTLSLHDALPICTRLCEEARGRFSETIQCPYHAWTYTLDGTLIGAPHMGDVQGFDRSEEHTSELQSRLHLVCRLLLEKKKNRKSPHTAP